MVAVVLNLALILALVTVVQIPIVDTVVVQPCCFPDIFEAQTFSPKTAETSHLFFDYSRRFIVTSNPTGEIMIADINTNIMYSFNTDTGFCTTTGNYIRTMTKQCFRTLPKFLKMGSTDHGLEVEFYQEATATESVQTYMIRMPDGVCFPVMESWGKGSSISSTEILVSGSVVPNKDKLQKHQFYYEIFNLCQRKQLAVLSNS